MKRLIWTGFLVSLLALPALAAADDNLEGGTIELSSTAEIEIHETLDDGTQVTRRLLATKVIPGDEVIFTLQYRNYGEQPAEDVYITNPIPKHMEFQSADAPPAGATITYSIDDGRSFGELATLRVPAANGNERPAVASDCTHIRWTFDKPLQPGQTGSVAYTALLQ
jgi:uncharacterized repeat protein (TIGR01451 family)